MIGRMVLGKPDDQVQLKKYTFFKPNKKYLWARPNFHHSVSLAQLWGLNEAPLKLLFIHMSYTVLVLALRLGSLSLY